MDCNIKNMLKRLILILSLLLLPSVYADSLKHIDAALITGQSPLANDFIYRQKQANESLVSALPELQHLLKQGPTP